jgi:hypothetical protein
MLRVRTDTTADFLGRVARLRFLFPIMKPAWLSPSLGLQFTQQAYAQFPESRIKERRDTHGYRHNTQQRRQIRFLFHTFCLLVVIPLQTSASLQ